MQIVIDVPEKYLNSYIIDVTLFTGVNNTITDVNVENEYAEFQVLPKGHGELIDKDETLKAMDTWEKFGYTETGCLVRNPGNDYVPYVHYEDMVKAVSGMPTIIEADKGAEND